MEELGEQYRRWRHIEIINEDIEGVCALCAACMELQQAAAVDVTDTCTVGLLRQWVRRQGAADGFGLMNEFAVLSCTACKGPAVRPPATKIVLRVSTMKGVMCAPRALGAREGDQGEQGKQGEQGHQGDPGKNGEQGKQGDAGKNGANGKNGLRGKDGEQGKQVGAVSITDEGPHEGLAGLQ